MTKKLYLPYDFAKYLYSLVMFLVYKIAIKIKVNNKTRALSPK